MTNKNPVDITVKISGGLEKEINIVEDEKLLVKRYKIEEVPSNIEIEATGSGCAVIQVNSLLLYKTFFVFFFKEFYKMKLIPAQNSSLSIFFLLCVSCLWISVALRLKEISRTENINVLQTQN